MRWYLMKYSMFLFLFIAVSHVSLASGLGGRWESLGPEGAYIRGSFVNPDNENEWMAITENPITIYRSRDKGLTWTFVSLLVDCENPWIIALMGNYHHTYIVLNSNLFASHDDGATWEQYPIPSDYAPAIGFNPSNSKWIYKTGVQYLRDFPPALVLYSSKDGGQNWESSRVSNFHYFRINKMIFDPANPAGMELCGYSSDENFQKSPLWFCSKDNGVSWEDRSKYVQHLGIEDIKDILIDPEQPARMYIQASTECYRTEDSGTSWYKLPYVMHAARLDPNDASIVYGIGDQEFLIGRDHGRDWSRNSSPGFPEAVNNIEITTSSMMICAGGLLRSDDMGKTWISSASGIKQMSITSMEFPVSSPGYLSIMANGRFFRSKDDGITWENYVPSLAGSIIINDNSTAITNEEIDSRFHGKCSAQDLSNPDILYLGGCWNEKPFDDCHPCIVKSMDGGKSWDYHIFEEYGNHKGPYARFNTLAISPVDSKVLFAGGIDAYSGLVLRSTDGGGTWMIMSIGSCRVECSEGVKNIFCDPLNINSVIVAAEGGVFVSQTMGATWVDSNLKESTSSIVQDPISKIFFAGTDSSGVYYSRDRLHWFPLNEGLFTKWIRFLSVDPVNHYLFAGTGGSGVWRYGIKTGINDWNLF